MAHGLFHVFFVFMVFSIFSICLKNKKHREKKQAPWKPATVNVVTVAWYEPLLKGQRPTGQELFELPNV